MTDFTEDERRAVALYAILARDWRDFIDMLPDETDAVLKDLYLMLVTPNPKLSTDDVELNQIGGRIVAGHLRKREIALPEIPTN